MYLTIQISILLLFACLHRVRSWQLTCPDSSQWNFRAKGFCNISKPAYYCLFNANSLHYKDFCRDKQDFHKPGHKYIIRGDIDGEPCEENRYQPFKFQTNGNNQCIFGKSVCNEEGQIVQNTGNTTTDTSCRCDYTNGYGFVIEPTQRCFCHPTQEDCSCYKKKCSNNEFLNPNYECGTHLIGDFDCPKIKTNRLHDRITVDSAIQLKPTIPALSSLDVSGYKFHIHTAKLVILIFTLTVLFVVVCFITFGERLMDRCRQFVMMEEIISMKVQAEIAHYRKEQYAFGDSTNKDMEQLKINDTNKQYIHDWIKDDTKFIVTFATHEIYKRLKTNSCVLVVGRAGNGKSSIVRHIALQLGREEQYDIIPKVLFPCNILEFRDRKQKQIFIIDDLCGTEKINAQSVDEWVSQIDEILKLIDTSRKRESKYVADIKFLFTTGSNIYHDSIFQKHKLLQKYEFLLSEWPLTDNEKLKMIKKYISPEAEMKLCQKLESDEAYFPLLCKIAERKTADQVIQLFSNLNKFIEQDLELIAFEKCKNLKFFVITLCALLNNNFKENILDGIYDSEIEKQAFENVCFEFNLEPDNDTVKSKIKEQLENLEEMYVAKTENYYHFIHSKVYKVAVSVCGQTFLYSFIKFVRSSFIAERFCFNSLNTDNRKTIINIDDKDAEKRYFDRLMFDLEQGDTYSTFHNSQLRSKSYRTRFCSYCRTRKQKLSELLKPVRENIDTEKITFAERDYEDYTEFAKQHHFFAHKMRKPLIESAWEGYADIVQMLLECACDINEAEKFGRTALFVACLLGKTEVVNVLLKNHADHSLCDIKKQSPLLVASREGYDDIVEALLQSNADVNQCDEKGNTPFLAASSGSHLETVKRLSREIKDYSKANHLGQTPLFVACMKGRENVVKYLLSLCRENISKPDIESRSPLFIACKEGYHDIVKLLLCNHDYPANVSQSDWNKRSPLFIASAEGYEDIVNMLLQNNAKINQCDEEGRTPLFIASDKGRTATVKILVNSGADLNATDHRKCTPLYAACRRGFIDIVKMLTENKAHITQCNKWNSSPLFAACRQGYLDIVKYLVENGCIISDPDYSSTTPLLVACENGHTDIVKTLIQYGADINQSDQCKKTPLHASAVGGHTAIVKVLIKEGAHATVTNNDNQTPLDLARKRSSTNIVNLLLSNK